jgi:hypothetical protein
MRTPLGEEAAHATVLDADLLTQKGDLLAQPLVVLFESDASIEAISSRASGEGDGELGERYYADDGGPDTAWPAFGQRQP